MYSDEQRGLRWRKLNCMLAEVMSCAILHTVHVLIKLGRIQMDIQKLIRRKPALQLYSRTYLRKGTLQGSSRVLAYEATSDFIRVKPILQPGRSATDIIVQALKNRSGINGALCSNKNLAQVGEILGRKDGGVPCLTADWQVCDDRFRGTCNRR